MEKNDFLRIRSREKPEISESAVDDESVRSSCNRKSEDECREASRPAREVYREVEVARIARDSPPIGVRCENYSGIYI